MIILGIDPGLQITGFSIISLVNGKTQLIEVGVLKLKPKDNLQIRVTQFYDFILEKINTYQITVIALETAFIGKNAQSFLKLGYLRGILYLITQKNNLIIYEFAPRQIKQAVTGSGAATKEQVQTMVKRLFPKINNLQTYDASDAVAISLCGLWCLENKYSAIQT